MIRKKLVFLILAVFLTFPVTLHSESLSKKSICRASFINPFSDIDWTAVFPVQIGGVIVINPGEELKDPDKIKNPICVCRGSDGKPYFGIQVSFWEPARIIETTKVPYCFPTVGVALHSPSGSIGTRYGTFSHHSLTSQNAHLFMFNIWNILGIFLDIGSCLLMDGFDLAYVSEIDPTFNNDVIGLFFSPEAILFANPVAQFACAADAVASTAGWPVDQLFWCMGQWGSSYPFTGNAPTKHYYAGNANITSKLLYRESRIGVMWDPAVNECGPVLTPIWIKSHYKIQEVKPVKGKAMQIGKTSVLWEYGKNPPWGTRKNSPDNFSWLIFRRVRCCLKLFSIAP